MFKLINIVKNWFVTRVPTARFLEQKCILFSIQEPIEVFVCAYFSWICFGYWQELSTFTIVWELVDTLGIAKSSSQCHSKWVKNDRKKRRRWKRRNGRQAKRAREVKKILSFDLFHGRSMSCKIDFITHNLLSNRLNILAITDSWLTVQHLEDILRGICPDGFVSVHNPRIISTVGGVT